MAGRSLAGPLIVGAAVVVAALVVVIVGRALDVADSGVSGRVARQETATRGLERDVVTLRGRLDALEAENQRLATRVQILESGSAAVASAPPALLPGAGGGTAGGTGGGIGGGTGQGGLDAVTATDGGAGPMSEDEITDFLVARRAAYNKNLTRARQSYLRVVLGEPREDYGDQCQPPTNPRLLSLLESRDVGPIRVTMVRPALDSLARVVERLRREEPEIFAALGTAGALCARRVRGSDRSISTHSWGVAVDLKLAGRLDPYGDDGSQFGLLILAEFFNDEGWYWGAGYSREDSMHFEVSEETLRTWAGEGLL